MAMKSVIIYFGGEWVDHSYAGGDSRFSLIPSNKFNFEGLLHRIEEITSIDRHRFLISSFVEIQSCGKMRMDIQNDTDFNYIIGCSEMPQFFVVLSPLRNNKQLTVDTEMHELHDTMAVTEELDNTMVGTEELGEDVAANVADDDDIESLDNEESSSDANTELGNKICQQWIIPGADYNLSLPAEESLQCSQYSADILAKDVVFTKKEALFIALGLHHLHNRVQFDVTRSSTTRFKAICKLSGRDCPFLLQARCKRNSSLWRITKWKPKHTCRLDFRKHGARTVASKVIGAYFAPRLLTDGAVLKAGELVAELKRSFGVHVKYKVALSGRNHAIRMIYGDPVESFAMLPSYLHMITQTNPGSVVDLQTDSDDGFQYLFMALSASVSGFQTSCRPVIVVDGTHLKGKYKGIMFVAATKDANEQIFPLAVGLGDNENNDSWSWFLRQLRRAFGCPNDLLIVSDQHASIKHAVATVYPGVPHGICVYHLQKNLGNVSKDVHALFHRAAYCYKVSDFEKHMKAMQDANEHATVSKLQEVDPVRWAKCQCPVLRYNFETSNCAESVNGRLRWARRLPVCTLLECVRTMIGHWIVERRMEGAKRTHELTEYATEKLERSIEIGHTLEVEPINMHTFKVVGLKHTYVVDLSAKTCTCRQFDLDLIPCPHAAAAIFKSNQSYLSYVSRFYTMETYRETYGGEVYPIPHPDEWEVPNEIKSILVGFPTQPKQAGRPRVKRINSGVCSRCKKTGHNRAKCNTHLSIQQQDEIVIAKSPKSRKKRCSICRAPDHNKRRCPLAEHQEK